MTRLDVYLAENLGSRSKSQDAIYEGRISVNGKIITKPSFKVNESDIIDIKKVEHEFVSRAGHKLQAAFDGFLINVKNQNVLDIGASTGGFTQVCLDHGARKVYALDVGHLQLEQTLDKNPQVVKMEGFNARNINADTFVEPIHFLCMDVSFISCRTILEVVLDQLQLNHMVVLIKPQFECGPKALNKHGVLKNEKIAQQIVIDIERYVMHYFRDIKTIKSPLKGRNGNQEYLLYAKNRR